MSQNQTSTIRALGLAIIILSGLIIFGNSAGLAIWHFIFSLAAEDPGSDIFTEEPIFSVIFAYYVNLCIGGIIFGILFLIGGIYLRKFKLWACWLISGLTLFIVVSIWYFTYFFDQWLQTLSTHFTQAWLAAGQDSYQSGNMYASAIFWTAPCLFLIWFLNKKDMRIHFH